MAPRMGLLLGAVRKLGCEFLEGKTIGYEKKADSILRGREPRIRYLLAWEISESREFSFSRRKARLKESNRQLLVGRFQTLPCFEVASQSWADQGGTSNARCQPTERCQIALEPQML